ncbi:hypothetical protein [Mycolicibacterium sp. 624]|uniref:hypothetical protein n=1 Tax=Mycolicibacterium sp. 624 TaxID=3156314 RepID=UPI003395206B
MNTAVPAAAALVLRDVVAVVAPASQMSSDMLTANRFRLAERSALACRRYAACGSSASRRRTRPTDMSTPAMTPATASVMISQIHSVDIIGPFPVVPDARI